ncbi:nucleotidyltransferase domain-containing protein [Pseudanabaenaceae cyanobacterium LEGE 13415]|nr:nucleotidyltransferase domain-containing protein [Pseudanabaenaceae cyanobacterium LEGE 13415]
MISADTNTLKAIEQTKQCLTEHYGDRLSQLILYGSVARNEAHDESDIDLLVVLNPPFDYFQELRNIVELVYPIELETDTLVSARPAALDEFEQGVIQLYRNIHQDGIVL